MCFLPETKAGYGLAQLLFECYLSIWPFVQEAHTACTYNIQGKQSLFEFGASSIQGYTMFDEKPDLDPCWALP